MSDEFVLETVRERNARLAAERVNARAEHAEAVRKAVAEADANADRLRAERKAARSAARAKKNAEATARFKAHDIASQARERRDAEAVIALTNLNTATVEQIDALPSVATGLAKRIVDEREVAPFTSLQDFDDRVKGVGPKTMEDIRDLVTV